MYRPSELYPENWNRLRFAIFKRYGYRCQACGKYAKGDLHLHHIIPVRMGGTHTFDNLIPLCSECHYAVHAKLLKLNDLRKPTRSRDL